MNTPIPLYSMCSVHRPPQQRHVCLFQNVCHHETWKSRSCGLELSRKSVPCTPQVSPTATYKHTLSISSSLHVPVRAFKKVAAEKLPSLKDFYVAVQEGGTNEVLGLP